MLIFVFPGQGSQKKGMGESLFDEFEKITAKADEILGYSIKKLCLEDPGQKLRQTEYTQPSIYVVSALSYLKRIEEIGKKPDYVAGHSVGEYAALFASGAFDFETGLKLVKKRGELMNQVTGGGMAAVIGFSEEKVEDVLKANDFNNIDIANYNSPSQIVIAGTKVDIDRAKPVFEAAGVRLYIPLNVSGAFHSRYMSSLKEEFKDYLEKVKFSELTIPVISNIHARPYKQEQIKDNLLEQITHPVKWTESIRYLMGRGEMEYEEVGPGKVLTALIKTIQKETDPIVPDDIEEEQTQELEQRQAEKIEVEEATHTNVQEEKSKKPETIQAEESAVTRLIKAESLGDADFKRDYGIKYAYAAGSMSNGISSKELVIKMSNAGLIGYFGTGGLEIDKIEENIKYIQSNLKDGLPYGMNLLYIPADSQIEDNTVDLFLKYNVINIEASGYINITPSLVRYRLNGLKRNTQGFVSAKNRIMGKISRPEVAQLFLSPAPERIVKKLLEENRITQEEADLSTKVPMADDLCVEADSGGHTDQGVTNTLIPTIIRLRDELVKRYGYIKKVRVGAAGGIGTPEAAAAAFILGADFIVTGSINQCTVEAGTSNVVKDLLQQMNIQDTDYAPAADMFEMGAKVQVLKKGLFFPARANKLYALYQQYNSLDEIDEATKKRVQERFFKLSFEEIYNEVKLNYPSQEIIKAEQFPKHKMMLVFKWYLLYSIQMALKGNEEYKMDYQIFCGPALGAFNQWVKSTELENWKNRHVDEIAEKIMIETAELLNERFKFL